MLCPPHETEWPCVVASLASNLEICMAPRPSKVPLLLRSLEFLVVSLEIPSSR